MKWLYAGESFHLLDCCLNCYRMQTIQIPLCPLCTLVFLCGETCNLRANGRICMNINRPQNNDYAPNSASGMWKDTTQLGASTISLIFRSPATLHKI